MCRVSLISILSIQNDLPLTDSKNPCEKRDDFYPVVAIILPMLTKIASPLKTMDCSKGWSRKLAMNDNLRKKVLNTNSKMSQNIIKKSQL